jgi:hypothetical protein
MNGIGLSARSDGDRVAGSAELLVTGWLKRAAGNGADGPGAIDHGAGGRRPAGKGWLDHRLQVTGWLKRAASYRADGSRSARWIERCG